MTNMFRRLYDGGLDKQYLRVCSTFKLLKLCRIDEARAVELLAERRISNPHAVVSRWIETLEKNEWKDIPDRRTIMGDRYDGPRPSSPRQSGPARMG